MTDRARPIVVAGGSDALDDLLRRVSAAARDGVPVELVVPRDSSLLLTASEFRRLRDAIDRERLGVTLRSDDPLRGQLAGLLGIAAGPVPPELRDRLRQAAAVPPPPGRSAAGEPSGRRDGFDPGPGPGHGRASPSGNGIQGRTAIAPAAAPVATRSTATAERLEPQDRVVSVEVGSPRVVTPVPGSVAEEARAGEAVAAAGAAVVTGESWPERQEVAPAPPGRRPSRVRRRREGAGAQEAAPAVLVVDKPATPPPSKELTIGKVADRRERRIAPRWIGFVVGGMALVVLTVLAVALLMPRATVAVTLERVPVEGTLRYAIGLTGASGAGSEIAIPATPVTVEVRTQSSVPATGRLLEPDGTATAPVLFANPNPAPVTIEPGTTLASLGGPAFTVASAIEVPAADPATGAAGRAEGEVRAAEPGAGGNVGVGEIGGQLENGVYYSNRMAPAEGGTDREIPVVAEEDLAALDIAAQSAIAEAALAQATESLPEGARLLPETATLLAHEAQPDAAVGDEVDTVSAAASGTVQMLAFDPGGLETALREQTAEVVPVPEGRALDSASVRFGEPVAESASPDGVRFEVPVEADATMPFGPSERRALAERLAGGDASAAAALLGGIDGFTDWRVDYAPAWLPARMPGDPDRIEIEVEG